MGLVAKRFGDENLLGDQVVLRYDGPECVYI